MYAIRTELFTHRQIQNPKDTGIRPGSAATSDGYRITQYGELLKNLAILSYRNPKFKLLFRGQVHDYRSGRAVKKPNPSSFLPAVYRNANKNTQNDLEERDRRFDLLERKRLNLTDTVKNHTQSGIERLRDFPQIAWAILQHYEVCDTPLLDLTGTPSIAASFAQPQHGNEGFFYVFGMPQDANSFSVYPDDRMIVINLNSTAPPHTHRPHFQDAYFVGRHPVNPETNTFNDLNARLIAKFRIDFTKFWPENFAGWQEDMIFPENTDLERDIRNLAGPN